MIGKNMSNIRHVFLDIDDTLFDFKRSEAKALSETLSELGIKPTDETAALYSKINKSQWEALERGEVTREVLLVRRYEILFKALGVDIEPRAAQSLYERHLSRTYFFLPGAQKLLSDLYGKYEVYLASNGTAIVQDGRISLSGIAKFATDIFISEKLGANKPSREFFDACFRKIKSFDKDAAIMVGDSPTSDILGGKNAGIKTCLYNPSGTSAREDIPADFEIKSLGELIPLLDSIQ